MLASRIVHSGWLLLVMLAACGRSIDHARAKERFTEVALDTAPGLSGLAVDEMGALWTVAERASTAYRITLDATLHPAVEAFAVEGVPDGHDLEGIAALGGDAFALGTEGRDAGTATILRAERRGTSLVVTGSITIPEEAAGVALAENHGAEGVCGHGAQIIMALETAGIDHGRRWAPVLRIVDGVVVRSHRLWLTSRTGKVSGLDCTIDPDGTVHAWAIERHFEVTKVLSFTLPVGGPDAITPTELLDLGPVLKGRFNLEGIARLPDGRLVTVHDNQWKTIDGPSRLFVFRR